MFQLVAIAPELLLTVGAIGLMMAAAFAGRHSTGAISWIAVLLLVVATVLLAGSPSGAGPLFDGLVTADRFGAFGKLIIFLSAAVAIIAALGWFESDFEHGAEYPVLILFSSVGMAVMVSATDLISLYVGLELLSLASY